MPNFLVETKLLKPVIGIDEVGRGPLAGPVVSCACVYNSFDLSKRELELLNDSKKLTNLQKKKSI